MSGLLAGKVWLSALAPHLKPLAATLADIANDDGTSIYPTLEYVAWRLGAGVRTVSRNIGELLEMSVLIEVAPAHHHQPPEYRLDESKLPKRASWSTSKPKNRVAKMATQNSDQGSHQRQSGTPFETNRVATNDRSGWPFGADSLPLSLNDPSEDPLRDPSKKRECPAEAGPTTAAALVATWNEHRTPGPTVSKVTPERKRLYDRALAAEPNLEDWRVAIAWLNRQPYANAPGTGEHATWRASLDWLAKPGQLAKVLDNARTDATAPRKANRFDLPTQQLTDSDRASLGDQRRRRQEFDDTQEALRREAAELVLMLSDQAREQLERDVLGDLEQYRNRMTTASFDDMVCKTLPHALIARAAGRPLVEVVAELEGKVVAA